MSWTSLRPEITTLLESIPEIQEVSAVPKIKFNGYPAVHVIPSENSGDYETTSENERTYTWTIRAFYETKNSGMEKAFVGLEEIVDKIIDAFDLQDLTNYPDRTIGKNLPERYTYISTMAVPNRWADLPDEELLMAEIAIRIKLSVDIS